MKILVTGGAGFIGTNFILYWLKKYSTHKIFNLDALTYAGKKENLSSLDNNPNYKFVKGDICDKNLVNNLVNEVDLVVHFAAESHVDRSILDSSPFVTTNVLGTQVLLDAALKNGKKRFHHISTDEVFGALKLNTNEKFTLSTPYAPRSPYSASKAGSDHLVRSYFITHNLPVTISNCSNNYGPYHFPEKLIPLAITNILEDKKVPVYGDGLYVRDWLYVEDHCRAIDLIVNKGKIGNTYLIGGLKSDISNLDLIKLILKKMHKTEDYIYFVNDRPGHDRRYAVDWTITNKELGWEPTQTLEEGLEKTIKWYKENHNWWKNKNLTS